MKIFNEIAGDESYSSGNSDDNKDNENQSKLLIARKNKTFKKMSKSQQRDRVSKLWQVCYSNCVGGAIVIKIFKEVHKDIMLYGTTMHLNKKLVQTLKLKTKCILLPDNPFKAYWNLFMALLLLYTAIYLPYNICFNQDEEPSDSIN